MAIRDGLKILVADDDRFMRATIRLVLRAAGRFDVREADDGDTGLEEVEHWKPDVVLCDITMPRVGGLQFVERLRKHPDEQIRGTPVIILTGSAEVTTVVAAAKLQINGYLVKPISPKQIGDQLHKVFAARPPIPLF